VLNGSQEESPDEDNSNQDLEISSFGAVRVILVRDEQTRRELQEAINGSAIVLTILQSKGMEFEDVYLYNFFSSNPYGLNFKILEELLIKQHHPPGMSALLSVAHCAFSLTHLYSDCNKTTCSKDIKIVSDEF
jgi:hypothetical protein